MIKITALIFILIISLCNHTFAENFNHSLYDTLLQKHVSNGMVDYGPIKNGHKTLEEYLKQLENVDEKNFKIWSTDEKKAFLINAYNAITIEGIIRNYPIEWGGFIARMRFPKRSIRQIKDF